MSNRWRMVVAMCATVVLAGCGKSTDTVQSNGGGGATVTDQAQVASVLSNNPEYVNEDVWESADDMPVDSPIGAFAAVRPLRFKRVIDDVQRNVTTEYSQPDSAGRPTLALVTVTRRLTGRFLLAYGAADSADTSRGSVAKPLDDLATRKLLLARVVRGDSAHWRLVGTSGVQVRTNGGQTRIQSVRVQSAGLDTTIVDPLAMHRLRRILVMRPNMPVTLTVTTGRPDDVVLFYGRELRRRCTNLGNGQHSFTFPSGSFPGLRHIGVDVLSRGTLFDDQAPYDSDAWMFAIATLPEMGPVDRR